MSIVRRLVTLSLVFSSAMAESRQVKTLYLIRHAESEENRRLGCLKNAFKDASRFRWPSYSDLRSSVELLDVYSQVDSELSEIGRKQVEHMAGVLKDQDFLVKEEIQLVAHSPLGRARQTSLGMLGCLAPDTKHHAVLRVEETTRLIEKTPAEWIPGNYASFATRLAEFEKWILSLSEERVALVGHSQFFKAMLGLDFKFGNCDVWKVELSNGLANPDTRQAEEYPKLPPQWSNLQLLYACPIMNQEEHEQLES